MIKERKWLVDLAGGAAVYPAAYQDMGIEMCPCSDFQTKTIREGEDYPPALFPGNFPR